MHCNSCFTGIFLLGLIPYVASVLPGIWLVKGILRCNRTIREKDSDIQRHLPLSGWIGVFERWIIIFFVIEGHPEGIAFLVAAKGLLRIPDLRSSSSGGEGDPGLSPILSSYVLLGTLVSIVVALIIAKLWIAFRPFPC